MTIAILGSSLEIVPRLRQMDRRLKRFIKFHRIMSSEAGATLQKLDQL
jgi:hypothetical protein